MSLLTNYGTSADKRLSDLLLVLGTPVTDISADIAAVQADLDSETFGLSAIKTQVGAVETDTQDIQTKVGTPAGASLAADIAAVKAVADAVEVDTQDLQSKVGTPVVTLADDIAGVQTDVDTAVSELQSVTYGLSAIKTQVAAVEADTQDLQTKVGTPVGASLAADIAAAAAIASAIETDTQDIQSKIGTPTGVSVSADVAALQATADAIEVDTQDLQSKVGTPVVDLAADIASVKSIVEGISSGSGDFVVHMEEQLERPETGTIDYIINIMRRVNGVPTDFVGDVTVSLTRYEGTSFNSLLYDDAATPVQSQIATKKSDGVYRHRIRLGSGIATGPVFLEVTGSDGTNTLTQLRSARIDEAFTVAWSTANANTLNGIATQVGSNYTAILGVETDTQDIQSKIGTPAGVSVSADIAAVQADTDDIQSKIGTPAGASLAADIAAVQADTDDIQLSLADGTNGLAAIKANVAAVEADTQDIQSKIGTPAGASVSADIAAIQADTDDIQSTLANLQTKPIPLYATSVSGAIAASASTLVTLSTAQGFSTKNALCGQFFLTPSAADGKFYFIIWRDSGKTKKFAESIELKESDGQYGVNLQQMIYLNGNVTPDENIYIEIFRTSGSGTSTYTVELYGVKLADLA